MGNCVICGRHLRTGIKYCYTCRSLQHAKGIRKKKDSIKIMFLIVVMCVYFYVSSFFVEGGWKDFFRVFSVLIGLLTLMGLLAEFAIRARRKRNETTKGDINVFTKKNN